MQPLDTYPEVPTQEEHVPPSRLNRRKRKKWPLLLLLALLLIGVGVFAALRFLPRQQSQYELDANALSGFLPGRTEEEIQAELNRILEKGFFNVSLNPTPVLTADGMLSVNIENVPANHYWMQVDLYLVEADGSERLLYQSKAIAQGFYIESGKIIGAIPAPGKYNGRADVTALMPETMEVIGNTAATLLVTVAGEGGGK